MRSKLQSTKEIQFDKARCELIRQQISDSRFYPLVGSARMVEGHYKITIWLGDRTDVYLIDETRLIRDP